MNVCRLARSRSCDALVLWDLRRLVLLVPTTDAYAWWEFVEALSGPGRWTGPDIDARIMCFVDTRSRPENKAAMELLDTARGATPSDEEVRGRERRRRRDAPSSTNGKRRCRLGRTRSRPGKGSQVRTRSRPRSVRKPRSTVETGQNRPSGRSRTLYRATTRPGSPASLTPAERAAFDQKVLSPLYADTERTIRAHETASLRPTRPCQSRDRRPDCRTWLYSVLVPS